MQRGSGWQLITQRSQVQILPPLQRRRPQIPGPSFISGRFRDFSGLVVSWCGGVELQSTEVEVDRGLEVLSVAVAACGDADGLDAVVEAFGAGVGDPVGEVGQQPGFVAFEGLRRVDDRLESGVGGPEVPAFEVFLSPTATLVGPEVAQALLDRPGAGGLQVTGPQGWRSGPGDARAGSPPSTATGTSTRPGSCRRWRPALGSRSCVRCPRPWSGNPSGGTGRTRSCCRGRADGRAPTRRRAPTCPWPPPGCRPAARR